MGKKQELQNLETERDAALLEVDRLQEKIAQMEIERLLRSKRISMQRRELHRLNLAIRSANFRCDEMWRQVVEIRKHRRELGERYDALLAPLRQEIERLRAEQTLARNWYNPRTWF